MKSTFKTNRSSNSQRERAPDFSPTLSPDGNHIAYLGFDDRRQGYQLTQLYVMKRDGSDAKLWSGKLDRSISRPKWISHDFGLLGLKNAISFQYDDQGVTKVGMVGVSGEIAKTATHVGGVTIGRPYSEWFVCG